MGTLEKRETTRKKTKDSLLPRFCDAMNTAQSAELQMLLLALPTDGAKILARYLESMHVGMYDHDDLGWRGISGLWSLGRAYRKGT